MCQLLELIFLRPPIVNPSLLNVASIRPSDIMKRHSEVVRGPAVYKTKVVVSEVEDDSGLVEVRQSSSRRILQARVMPGWCMRGLPGLWLIQTTNSVCVIVVSTSIVSLPILLQISAGRSQRLVWRLLVSRGCGSCGIEGCAYPIDGVTGICAIAFSYCLGGDRWRWGRVDS